MAATGNAIGSAAVILSANADRLVGGLDRAEKHVTDFAHTTDKKLANIGKSAGGKGGLLGSMFSGGAIGGAAGAAAGVALKGFEALFRLPEKIDQLAESATGATGGRLASLSETFDRFGDIGNRLLVGVITPLAPALELVAESMERWLGDGGDGLGKIGAAVEAVTYYWAELYTLVIDEGLEVIGSIQKWAQETLGLATTTDGASDQMFAALRMLGKGFAYVWDTVKAGAGAITYVTGAILEGVGIIVKALGELIQRMHELDQRLPRVIRTNLFGDAAESVKGWGANIDAAGDKMQKWGRGAVAAWGDSSIAVGKWFDGVQARLKERAAAIDQMEKKFTPKLSGAFQAGSVEAYSINAKFQSGASGSFDIPKEQLRVAKEQLRIQKEQLAKMAEDADEVI